MHAMCHVQRSMRSGAPTALLILAVVLGVVLGEGGSVPARPPVALVAESALGGGECQPSDAVDSEVRGSAESARGARRARVRSGSRGRAVGAEASYRRTRTGRRSVRPVGRRDVPVDVPATCAVRRWVVLRC
ncbi:hypothetical protein J7E96_29925 [Streptomyces sp. ISL-96]|uniref:hypothetical protein n=1 Tax=Streptomyces sp. ISL-96 TaxID=2819191 RepID=UPI001BE67AC7|nr:hypothetical protein [Streptomyces sp. ISL-96]MBT2492654.1 hypothetical protein [Streptomyces sp. ISL-96]